MGFSFRLLCLELFKKGFVSDYGKLAFKNFMELELWRGTNPCLVDALKNILDSHDTLTKQNEIMREALTKLEGHAESNLVREFATETLAKVKESN